MRRAISLDGVPDPEILNPEPIKTASALIIPTSRAPTAHAWNPPPAPDGHQYVVVPATGEYTVERWQDDGFRHPPHRVVLFRNNQMYDITDECFRFHVEQRWAHVFMRDQNGQRLGGARSVLYGPIEVWRPK